MEATHLNKSTRATEPSLRNAIDYFFYNLNMTDKEKMYHHLEIKNHEVMHHLEDSEKKIIAFAEKKVKNGMIVYTHCHSSTVCKILIAAKNNGKKFEVHNTETRPLYQGRKTAKELTEAGIPVTHYIDSGMRHAIKKADLIFLGVDAITTTKVLNKIGSETIAIIAADLEIPIYCCADSWKFDFESIQGFDEEIEERHTSEVWKDAPKGVTIHNYAFDRINPKYHTGIISELGVLPHSMFIEQMMKSKKK